MSIPQATLPLDPASSDSNTCGQTPMTPPAVRTTWRVDVSDSVPLSGCFEIAVDVIAPSHLPEERPAVVLACLPGGFLSRRYYDLEGPGGSRDYSFAEAMAVRGFITLAFDHIGVGESTKPDPIEGGYALGVEEIALANQRALEIALARLAEGDALAGIPSAPLIESFGVGHSMGSALTVEQQALAAFHRGLILFSFTTRGVPRFLSPAQQQVADDPRLARQSLAKLTREAMGTPYPASASDSEGDRVAAFGVGTAPPSAEEALHGASSNLLGMAGLLSMIPGAHAPSAERIQVPVLIALGDHDLHDDEGTRRHAAPVGPRLDLCPRRLLALPLRSQLARTAVWTRDRMDPGRAFA